MFIAASIRKGTSQSRDPVQAAQKLFEAIQQHDIKFAAL